MATRRIDPYMRAIELMVQAAGQLSELGEFVFLVSASPDQIQVKNVSDSHLTGPILRGAQRRRVTEDRLSAVRTAYEAGGIREVMQQEQVGERQAWRLKAAANA